MDKSHKIQIISFVAMFVILAIIIFIYAVK